MNRLNKYTLVSVEEDVLNASSNEETEDKPHDINGLRPLNEFLPPTSEIDQKSKRNIWQEIEYLAATNKEADKIDAGMKQQVPNATNNFIFPFLNPENSRNSNFKRDYFSFDDDDFNLLVPENSAFQSIDSSSSDDDDGRFYYRSGRYRLDTIQEENEEDLESSSLHEDSTDLEGRSAIIFNSSFAASNESEGSIGLINIDRKLSLELLKERKKKLQERQKMRRMMDDSSTDEESVIPKAIFAKHSLAKKRLRNKILLDMIPISSSQTKENDDQSVRLDPSHDSKTASQCLQITKANNELSNALANNPSEQNKNSSNLPKMNGPIPSASISVSKCDFKETPVKTLSYNQPKFSQNSISTVSSTSMQSLKPHTTRVTNCSTILEKNPVINMERFDIEKENTKTIATISTQTNLQNSTGTNNQRNELKTETTVAHDSWHSINDFLQNSKFSLDSNDIQHSLPSRSKEISKLPPDDIKIQTQSTQTSNLSTNIVYRKYYPNTPTSTSSTQTQQTQPKQKIQQSQQSQPTQQMQHTQNRSRQSGDTNKPIIHKLGPSEPQKVFTNSSPIVLKTQKPKEIQFNIHSSDQTNDPRIELVKSKISNIKLKPPPSSIERQWSSVMYTNKPREIKVISTGGKLISSNNFSSNPSTSKHHSSYSSQTPRNSDYLYDRKYYDYSNPHKLSQSAQSTDPYHKVKFSDHPDHKKHASYHNSVRKSKTLYEKVYRPEEYVKSVADLSRLGCRETNLRSMSESELRVWLSLQKLDIPEWYLAYPDKNKDTVDLKNTRSVNDIMADIEKLSIPGEKRILGDLNLTKSVPSLVLLQEQQQQQEQRSKAAPSTSKRWSTHLPANHHYTQDNISFSLPQHYRKLKWSLNDYNDSNYRRRQSKSSTQPKSFTLPSEQLKTKSKEVPFRAVTMPAFDEIMKGIDIPAKKETKGEVLSEKLVKQNIPPEMGVSFESPHVVRIRRIKNPDELQREKEVAKKRMKEEIMDAPETYFPAESGGKIESFLPHNRSNDPSSGHHLNVYDVTYRPDQVSLPRSARSSRSFVEGDFQRRISHHYDRPLKLFEDKQTRPTEQAKSLPDDSGFGSDLTPLVSNHVKRESIFSNIHILSRSPNKDKEHGKNAVQDSKKSSGKTILNSSSSNAAKEKSKLSSFSFGFFRSSKKTPLSTSSQKKNLDKGNNNINKLNHEMQRGSFAPFIEHRV